MTRSLTSGMVTAITAGTVFPCLLAEIDTLGGNIYVWSGIGSLVWNGNTYLGVGDFGGVSTIEEASDLTATGCTFSLSGVNDAYLAIALSQIRQGKAAILYVGALDSSGNLVADPYLLFQGITDVPQLDESGETSVITITAENRLVDLSRPKIRRYTTADQQLDDATDLGFEFVPSLQDAVIHFGG